MLQRGHRLSIVRVYHFSVADVRRRLVERYNRTASRVQWQCSQLIGNTFNVTAAVVWPGCR